MEGAPGCADVDIVAVGQGGALSRLPSAAAICISSPADSTHRERTLNQCADGIRQSARTGQTPLLVSLANTASQAHSQAGTRYGPERSR
jgi:hypothetical protein